MTKQEQMNRLIERQRTSGSSVDAFCKQGQVTRSTFYYWLKKERDSDLLHLPLFREYRCASF